MRRLSVYFLVALVAVGLISFVSPLVVAAAQPTATMIPASEWSTLVGGYDCSGREQQCEADTTQSCIPQNSSSCPTTGSCTMPDGTDRACVVGSCSANGGEKCGSATDECYDCAWTCDDCEDCSESSGTCGGPFRTGTCGPKSGGGCQCNTGDPTTCGSYTICSRS